ncbi:MAG: hypothetical protein ABI462_05525, partial [Ignavibacteria bacterium]
LKKTYSNFGDTTADFVRNDPKANAGRHVGTVVFNINEIGDAINNAIQNPGELSSKRKDFARQLSYNTGNAADTAAQNIMDILKI